MHWTPAYIALGSNLDNPRHQIAIALERIGKLPDTRLIAASRLYLSSPMGPQDQPDFINAAAGVLTRLPAQALLAHLKHIERDMGREPPAVRWGARLIDLDLLMHGTLTLNETDLTLPHPGIHERNFVLYPLADFAPTLKIPGRGSVEALARRVGSGGLKPLSE